MCCQSYSVQARFVALNAANWTILRIFDGIAAWVPCSTNGSFRNRALQEEGEGRARPI
jgi:hypothetical protein